MCFYGHLHQSTLLAWVESVSWILESRHVPPTRWRLGCFILSLLGHTGYPLTLQGSIKKLASEVASTANSNRRVYASLLCVVPEMPHTHWWDTCAKKSCSTRAGSSHSELTPDLSGLAKCGLCDCGASGGIKPASWLLLLQSRLV